MFPKYKNTGNKKAFHQHCSLMVANPPNLLFINRKVTFIISLPAINIASLWAIYFSVPLCLICQSYRPMKATEAYLITSTSIAPLISKLKRLVHRFNLMQPSIIHGKPVVI